MSRKRRRKTRASKGHSPTVARQRTRTHAAPSKCVCLKDATACVHAQMLDDSVALLIGTCDRHAPRSDAQAMALVRALLAGIARTANDIDMNARTAKERDGVR